MEALNASRNPAAKSCAVSDFATPATSSDTHGEWTIHDKWVGLFNIDEIKRIAGIIGDNYTPREPFKAFNFTDPMSVKCVIIGQDPYPAAGVADGLCFSAGAAAITASAATAIATGSAVPASLARIFGCLEFAGLKLPRSNDSSDLHSWAMQDVLMLNTALTTRVGEVKAHSALWRPIIDAFINAFCSAMRMHGRSVPFMMWGRDAQRYVKIVEGTGNIALCWTHPSPLSDNCLDESKRFKMCPHFNIVNRLVDTPIIWDNRAPCIALTDGSCPLNGKPGARASFAVVVGGAHFKPMVVSAEIRPNEYLLNPVSARGTDVLANECVHVTPSNNRGELMGVIYALKILIDGHVLGDVEIVSDSKITVNTLLSWLPSRLEKGTAHELKNYDLVMIAWELYNRLKSRALSVTLTHCRSHQKTPPATASAREKFIHMGNDIADRYAMMAFSHGYEVQVKIV